MREEDREAYKHRFPMHNLTIIGNTVRLYLDVELEGSAVKHLAESYVDFFKKRNAKNYVEVGFSHPEVGRMTVTLQKQTGITPCEKIARHQEALRQVREYLEAHAENAIAPWNPKRGLEIIDEALAL